MRWTLAELFTHCKGCRSFLEGTSWLSVHVLYCIHVCVDTWLAGSMARSGASATCFPAFQQRVAGRVAADGRMSGGEAWAHARRRRLARYRGWCRRSDLRICLQRALAGRVCTEDHAIMKGAGSSLRGGRAHKAASTDKGKPGVPGASKAKRGRITTVGEVAGIMCGTALMPATGRLRTV